MVHVQFQQGEHKNVSGADIGSDIALLLTTIKQRLKHKRVTKKPRIRFDLETLKVPDIAEVFQAQNGKCLQPWKS